jgi:HAD superfamily hydrolase (TIGR01490 family)
VNTTPGAHRPVAFFDVDGTLCDTTIAHYFRFFMFERLTPMRRWIWYPFFLIRCGYYLLLDRIDRGRLNVVFYRNYAGLPAAQIKARAEACEREVVGGRWLEDAGACVAEHRAAGRDVVLVTGCLDFIVEPLARRLGASALLAPKLLEADGRFTGELGGPALCGEQKARAIREYAAQTGADLAVCHAYGDSFADAPMLEAVGFAHAVNPDAKLAALAARRGWPVHRWAVSAKR